MAFQPAAGPGTGDHPSAVHHPQHDPVRGWEHQGADGAAGYEAADTVCIILSTAYRQQFPPLRLPEAGDLRVPRVLGENGLALFLDRLRGNLDRDLA